MNDYNKILWALAIISVNGLITLALRHVKSDIIIKLIFAIFVLILLFVSVSWTFFDYWI